MKRRKSQKRWKEAKLARKESFAVSQGDFGKIGIVGGR